MILYLGCVTNVLEISKCDCPPTAETYEDEEGMLICKSCGGWVESKA